jgi:ribonuclease-3
VSGELLKRLGVKVNPELLELAITHSSFSYENSCESNERLEFLGDSILGYIVASHIFQQEGKLPEGDLTRLKNSIVSAEALAVAARRLGLGEELRLGKGEESSGGRDRLNILADAMEAVIAATYLSSGLDQAKQLVVKHILPMLGDPIALREFADPKTTLTERLAKLARPNPRFEVQSFGPEHNLVYSAKCFSGDLLLGKGEGRTIRSAESAAAAMALKNMRDR